MGERGVASSVLLLIRNLTHRVDKEGKKEEKYGEGFFSVHRQSNFCQIMYFVIKFSLMWIFMYYE